MQEIYMNNKKDRYILSNLNIFYEIAKDSYELAIQELENHRTPKTDGGYLLTFDPKRKSFKNSLISISFSGSYLDLHLKISYMIKFNETPPKKWRMNNPYKNKLESLGITEKSLIDLCEKFSTARNDVSHEKPIIEGIESDFAHETAQDSAKFGIELIEAVRCALPLFDYK